MTYFTIFISLTLMLYNCKKSDDDSSADRHKNDSLSHVQSIQQDTIPTVPPPGRGLPPGQARVEGTVIAVSPEPQDARQTLRLQIRSILGYGPSTPPIPTGDTLDIPLSAEQDTLTRGTVIRARLHHNVSFQKNGKGTAWSLINIE
ncbi:hypothetical protein SAMN05443144_104204 [Fodinibius roseus]|uniref:Uncharacterized protein n=1 Tax=Fodinibius roseus TaxID=1194090 RepID=A0A1M4XSG0_9BACT|nr:hypothetical protein [Fodinibius roseus]SHE96401.1 hypothetical protein SAMN05443144_104204 [Fodinibius roseus]